MKFSREARIITLLVIDTVFFFVEITSGYAVGSLVSMPIMLQFAKALGPLLSIPLNTSYIGPGFDFGRFPHAERCDVFDRCLVCRQTRIQALM